MLTLIQFNLVSLLVAMAIGVVTGWWIFRRPARPNPSERTPEEPGTP